MYFSPLTLLMKNKGLSEGIKIFSYIEQERSKTAEILQEDIAQLVALANTRTVDSPDVSAYLKEAVSKLRLLAYEMKPQVLERFGLINALEELIEKRLGFNAKYKILLTSKLIDELHPTMRVVIFRLTQQLLNNTHIGTFSNLLIRAEIVTDYLCLKVYFDANFYSTVDAEQRLNELTASIEPIVYLFNGYHVVTSTSDRIKMTMFIKLI
jgi:signal transduction histidine kinase